MTSLLWVGEGLGSRILGERKSCGGWITLSEEVEEEERVEICLHLEIQLVGNSSASQVALLLPRERHY